MKPTTWKGGVLGATMLLLLAAAAVSETPVPYELQSQCTKDAEEFFTKANADKIPGALFGLGVPQKQRVTMLGHHFNGPLNKCFVKLHTVVWYEYEENGHIKRKVDNDQLAIWDINDYERGPIAIFRGFPKSDDPQNFMVDSCWAVKPEHLHDLYAFNECAGVHVASVIKTIDVDTYRGGGIPEWEAITKPFTEE